MEETWTILKVLEWTTGYFKRKDIEQPRANAEVLLAFVLGVERIQLYLSYDKPLTGHELALYREAVRRRADREPTQYITRRQEFWSLEFEVNPSVLIPRPETELLVEKALHLLKNSHQTILDLGTGSGAIAVSLAHEKPSLHIVATDKSIAAIQLARRNALRHHAADRISFAAMDLLFAFSSHAIFDLIITNPPYISEKEFCTLCPEIANHEPQMALRGGQSEGLDIIRRILRSAPLHLNPGGSLLIEIGEGQAGILERELCEQKHFNWYEIIPDYSGILRVLHLRKRKE